MERIFFVPVHYPRTTLALIGFLTIWLGIRAFDIRFDASIDSLLPANDPERVFYEDVKETFGSDEAAVIGVFADNVFAPNTIQKIHTISEALRDIDGVREVLSLTTVQGVEIDDFGAVQVGKLMKRLPETPEDGQKLKASIQKNPLYSAHLMSKDDRATGVLVLFDNLTDDEYSERNIEGRLREIVAAAGGPETYAVTGMHSLKVTAARLMKRDLLRFLPVSIFVLVVILSWAFRTLRGVLLPILSVSIGIIWTLGVMVLAGARINLGTLLVPPLLAAVGIAYVIHVVCRYYDRLESAPAGIDALRAAVSELGVPIVLAACTTLIGFVPLALSSIRAVREFGIFAIVGILIVLSVTEVFVPAVLVLIPEPKRGRGRYHGDDWVSRCLTGCATMAIRYRIAIIVGGAVLCLAGSIGGRALRIETDYLTFIDAKDPLRRDTDRITTALGGTQPLYFVVEGNGPQSVIQLPALAAIRDLRDFINEQPEVDKSLSLIDYLAVVRGALNPDAAPGLPEGQSEVSQLLVFVGPKELQPVANPDFSRANLVVGSRAKTSGEVRALIERVESYARARFPAELTLRASGSVALLNRSADVLAHGQAWGLAAVVVVLVLTLSVGLLSIRAGLAAIVPNIVPIAVMFGLMGILGITLSISTSLVATIAIGIAVADTLHYLTSFNTHLRATGNEEAAIRAVGREVGLPIALTSLVLIAGFSVVCLSGFTPVRQFGMLAASTMAGALLADLLILPALVRSAHLVTAWDLVRTKLGGSDISLFAGLRPFQAKIVVLMGKVIRVGAGTHVTRAGEQKDEMYVLLNGRAELRVVDDGPVLRTMRRGDVIGEMGLVRNRPRTANVVAAGDLEYFALDAASLARLQRRHPRIAATVLRNIARILSDRLEATTNELVQVSL